MACTCHNNTKSISYMYVYTCVCLCFFFLAHCPCQLVNPASGHADNVWWSTGEHTPHSWRHHPHPDAPRCIPCHYDDSSYVASPEATIPSYKAIKGCPCTPKLLCAHNNHSDHMSEDWFNKYCDMPRLPYHMYSMHGGAGALMSIGLMRKVGWDFVEPCVLKTFSTGACPTLPPCPCPCPSPCPCPCPSPCASPLPLRLPFSSPFPLLFALALPLPLAFPLLLLLFHHLFHAFLCKTWQALQHRSCLTIYIASGHLLGGLL